MAAARLLTLDQFSDLALVLALGSVLFFLSDAGYSVLLSAHVASIGQIQPAAVANAIRRRLVGSFLALGILVVAYWVAANDRSPLVPLLFLGSLAGNAVHGSVSAAFRSVGQARYEAANEVGSRVLVLAVGVAWLATGGGARAAVIAYSLGDLVSAAVLLVVLRRWTRTHPSPVGPLPELHWRRAVPIAVAAGFSTIYGRLDTWLVALLAPGGTAGLYAAAYRITETLRVPAAAVGAVALVDVAKLDPAAGAHLARRRALRSAALVTIPAIVLLVAAGPIMRLTFGPDFGAAGGMLRILALSSLASAVVSVLGPSAAVRRGTRYAVAVGIVALANGLANGALVPALGGQGAAWANLGSESLLAVLLFSTMGGAGAAAAPPGDQALSKT